MALNVRQRQADGIVRMLHFNAPAAPGAANRPSADDDAYKVLILDATTQDIVAPLLRVNELRRHGVTLHLQLHSDRQPIPDVPAVYFVAPTEEAAARIAEDARRGLYEALHLNFSTHLPRPLLERLAAGAVAGGGAARVARVSDQHNQFVALEPGLFSLGLPDTYVRLNDPRARDDEVAAAVAAVVEGLFCVLATAGVVPVIRCPRGGAAEHVAAALDARLRDALRARGNVFAEAAAGGGLAASLQRPLLCLFDRAFELSVMLQHAWTYKPLVHDALGLRLNRVALPAEGAGAPARAYDVDGADFFWAAHGREPFPRVAELVEAELGKYRASVEELNRRTGAGLDPAADPADLAASSTRSLTAAVSSLPELTERKRAIDKHTNVATTLLKAIKARGLDHLYATEEELIRGKGDAGTVERLVAPAAAGTPSDKLRLALVWLLTREAAPSDAECAALEAPLAAVGADMAAWAYAKRMRRLNLTGRAPGAPAGGGAGAAGGDAAAQLSSLLGSTFGAGLSSLTKGVKSLLAGEQQAAVTVAVEALMDGRPSPETDAYLTLDPRGAPGAAPRPAGAFREALVFVVGGGNYLEWESLATWAARQQPAPKTVAYGATELLGGDEFAAQLAELGRRSGA
jgi:hypothetical protein